MLFNDPVTFMLTFVKKKTLFQTLNRHFLLVHQIRQKHRAISRHLEEGGIVQKKERKEKKQKMTEPVEVTPFDYSQVDSKMFQGKPKSL